MPFAEHFMVSGVTTAAQTATLPASITINTGFLPTKIELVNETQYGVLGTGFKTIQTISWDSSFPNSTKLQFLNTAGTALLPAAVTTNGISLYDGTQSVLYGPILLGTTITQGAIGANLVTVPLGHGLQTGDIILMSNNAVMKQIGSLLFTVTVVSPTTFRIPISTAAFPAPETAFIARKLIVGPLFYPENVKIAAISATNPMVVSTTVAHRLTVGQKVRLRVSPAYGMVQANDVQGVITAVGSATTFTLGAVDASSFTTFAYPTTSAAQFAAQTFPQVIPVGAGPSAVTTPPFWFDDKLDDATTNVQFQGFILGSGLLQLATAAAPPTGIGIVAGDVFSWTAWRGDV